MGSKNDGFLCDHLNSKCCKAPIRFITTANGYSVSAWCSKCGNYVYNGRTEGLIALWLGDLKGVIINKGYTPDWITKKISDLRFITERGFKG